MTATPASGAPSSLRTRFKAALATLLGLAVLGALVWYANPSRVLHALRGAEPIWIAAALGAILVSTLLGAVNSYMMAAPGPSLGFGRFLKAYWVAWAVGQILPGQVGDLLGMSLFLRKRGLSLPAAVGRLGVDKLVSLFCTFGLSIGLCFIFVEPSVHVAGMLGVGADVLLIIVYLTSRRWSKGMSSNHKLITYLVDSLTEAHRVIATRPLAVITNASLTLLKLLVIGVCYWAAFKALQAAPGSVLDVTVTANSAGLIAYVPISANGVGTVEAGGVYLFGLKGVGTPLVVATYLVLRFANLALAWLGAALILLSGLWTRKVPVA